MGGSGGASTSGSPFAGFDPSAMGDMQEKMKDPQMMKVRICVGSAVIGAIVRRAYQGYTVMCRTQAVQTFRKLVERQQRLAVEGRKHFEAHVCWNWIWKAWLRTLPLVCADGGGHDEEPQPGDAAVHERAGRHEDHAGAGRESGRGDERTEREGYSENGKYCRIWKGGSICSVSLGCGLCQALSR
jgi:hypothetical protein